MPDAIKAAALALFVERGFEKTSVDDIVTSAGVTKGAMYHHFSSKQDLLFDIYMRLITIQSEHLAAIVSRPAPAIARLRAAAVDVILTSIEVRDEATVFFRSRHLLSPEHQAEVAARRAEYAALFEGLLQEGMDEGSVRGDLPQIVPETFFLGAVHYLAEWYDPDGPLTPAALADAYADLLIGSLAPRD